MNFFNEIEDFANSIPVYFEQVSNRIDKILVDVESVVTKTSSYIEFSTYYFWISGIMLLISIVLICIILFKVNSIAKANTELHNVINNMNIILETKSLDSKTEVASKPLEAITEVTPDKLNIKSDGDDKL